MIRLGFLTCSTAIAMFVTGAAIAQQYQVNDEQLGGLFSADTPYSPYVDRNFPERPLWGDSHLHTALSMDAGGFGNRLGLKDAYRVARGEQVTVSSGQDFRLGRPLD